MIYHNNAIAHGRIEIHHELSCSNLYIKPPILLQIGGDLKIYSSSRDIDQINESFVQIEFTDGNVCIYPNRLVLNGEKDELCVQFLQFLTNEVRFVQEHCHINFNNYMMVSKGQPIKISLNLSKNLTESEDWLFLKRIYDRYTNLKVFW